MRVRPIVPLAVIATSLVSWLSARMWLGGLTGVWEASCLLGAWAPLGAAAIFLYVRAVGDREHGVAAAWLVRALGMHCVLVWMLGASDWLRGPPGAPSGWNTDLGAPVVLLSFAPVFVLSVGILGWVVRVARRLSGPVLRPAMPSAHTNTGARPVVPFRGVALVSAGAPVARAPAAAVMVALAGGVLALATPVSPYVVLGATALPLAALTVRNHRSLAPSLATLAVLTGVVLSRGTSPGVVAAVARAVAWPWASLAAVLFYLAAVEALLQARRFALRA